MKTPSAATVQPRAEPNSRNNTKAALAFRVAPTNSVKAAPQVVAPPSAATSNAASSPKTRHRSRRIWLRISAASSPCGSAARRSAVCETWSETRASRALNTLSRAPDARQQEYRRQRHLYDVSDAIQGHCVDVTRHGDTPGMVVADAWQNDDRTVAIWEKRHQRYRRRRETKASRCALLSRHSAPPRTGTRRGMCNANAAISADRPVKAASP